MAYIIVHVFGRTRRYNVAVPAPTFRRIAHWFGTLTCAGRFYTEDENLLLTVPGTFVLKGGRRA